LFDCLEQRCQDSALQQFFGGGSPGDGMTQVGNPHRHSSSCQNIEPARLSEEIGPEVRASHADRVKRNVFDDSATDPQGIVTAPSVMSTMMFRHCALTSF